MAETTQERPLAGFAGVQRELAGSGPEWLRAVRLAALRRFEELGFPTSRLEQWKNTNVARLADTPWVPAPRRAIDARRLEPLGVAALAPHRLVFVDGRLSRELSAVDGLPQGVRAGSLRAALQACPDALAPHLASGAPFEDAAFTALNTACFEDGAAIQVEPNVKLDAPLLVLHLSSGGDAPQAAHPRTLLVAGDGSRVALIEHFAALDDGVYWNNAVGELVIGANAVVQHTRLQDEGARAFHVGALHARQGRDSSLTAYNFDLGAVLSRLDTVGVLDGEGGWCELLGMYVTRDGQHVDNHSVLDHAKPHCQSRELYKGILTGDSRAVFNGRIIVRRDAQKTDAKQSNPNLLLSDRALVHTRPQLEIYADDVKCTHGATIGRLDPEMLFYLRSRGIGAREAHTMLVHGFAREVLDRVEHPSLRERLEREVAVRLGTEPDR